MVSFAIATPPAGLELKIGQQLPQLNLPRSQLVRSGVDLELHM